MKPTGNKTFRIILGIILFGLVGGLGYLCYHLQAEKKMLAESYEQSESRNRLLNQKYKEEKALVGRLQRETLALTGQVRQARMDADKALADTERFKEEKDKLAREVQNLDEKKAKLEERIESLIAEKADLNRELGQTSTKLKAQEKANENLEAKNQSLGNDLKRALNDNKRYLAHNRRLAEIAKALVARVEKDELGSSVLAKEPLIQFQRVELEKLLQEYLDKIDQEKVVQQ